MKTLLQISTEARELSMSIQKKALAIHPKIISTLTDTDFSDQTLFDDTLVSQYSTIEYDILKANQDIWIEAQKYFNTITKDLHSYGIDIGFYDSGDELKFPLDMHDFEPSIHVSKIYNTIFEFKNYIELIPFWRRTSTIKDNNSGRWINIPASNKPTEYIKKGTDILSDKKLSSTDKIIIAVKTELQCGYKMHSTKYNLTNSGSAESTCYINNVIEHKVLEELLKHESGSYLMDSVIFNDDGIKVQIKEDTNAN